MPQTDSTRITKPSAVPRIDGALKVCGQAKYAADFQFPNLAFAVPIGATIANGKITRIDDTAAKKMKGVLGIYSHGTIGKLFRPAPEEGMNSKTDEARPPFEDEIIRYYGQYVAVAVAETLEIAKAAAMAIKVFYKEDKPSLSHDVTQDVNKKTESTRGDTKTAFAAAAVKHDATYVTPTEAHNPIEMHATIAVWDGFEKVTLYETSQAILNHQNTLAQNLGIPKTHVRVISKFIGAGFGGKLWPWNHSAIAAATARTLQRPVKLVVERSQMFTNVGHRPRTQQRIQLGADASGKLVSIQHDYANLTSILDDYKENCGEMSAMIYSSPNVLVTSGAARRNMSAATPMRGPGAVPGLFALESAMDELAIKLKMDPIQLRLKNEPTKDESKDIPFSSRHLKECYQVGAKSFGWEKRNSTVGSMKNGDEILGWGMAACSWQAKRFSAQIIVEFHPSGRVSLSCATQDIGTGTYTALAQMVQNETGIPFDRIDIVLGDTDLPPGPVSGGSMVTGSLVTPTLQAIKDAIKNLKGAASKFPNSVLHAVKPEEIEFEKEKVFAKGKPGNSFSIADVMKKANVNVVTGRGQQEGNFEEKKPNLASYSFGAHFVEIGWQPQIARLRVNRVVTAIDAGKIINYVPAKNQIEGSVVMGVGMAMFENVEYDFRYGNPVNNNLADYIVATNADGPEHKVIFLDYPDTNLNEYGARGVGEIGLAGIAAAITGAVYHATGVRVRELPIRIEDLIKV